MNPAAIRFGGVRIPEGQARDVQRSDAPTGTVVQLVEMKVCGVGIVDEEGRIISTVAYKVGGSWWTDPNGEEWIKGLLRAGAKLSTNLEGALKEYEDLMSAHTGKVKDVAKVNVTASRINAKTQKIAEDLKE